MSTLFKSTPIIAALALATASQLASAQQLEEVIVTSPGLIEVALTCLGSWLQTYSKCSRFFLNGWRPPYRIFLE